MICLECQNNILCSRTWNWLHFAPWLSSPTLPQPIWWSNWRWLVGTCALDAKGKGLTMFRAQHMNRIGVTIAIKVLNRWCWMLAWVWHTSHWHTTYLASWFIPCYGVICMTKTYPPYCALFAPIWVSRVMTFPSSFNVHLRRWAPSIGDLQYRAFQWWQALPSCSTVSKRSPSNPLELHLSWWGFWWGFSNLSQRRFLGHLRSLSRGIPKIWCVPNDRCLGKGKRSSLIVHRSPRPIWMTSQATNLLKVSHTKTMYMIMTLSMEMNSPQI